MFLEKSNLPIYFALIVGVITWPITIWFMVQMPFVYIKKRRESMDREVLFAGRYLLVKMKSGVPLLNALIDASQSYGVGSDFFREIVEDIYSGSSIEEAVEHARDHSPSHHFDMILSQIIVSLKTGADITDSLHQTLLQISKSQLLEIKAYAKKLGGIIMIYMVAGIILPALALTLFTVAAGFLSFDLSNIWLLVAIAIAEGLIQYIFIITLDKQKPTVNI